MPEIKPILELIKGVKSGFNKSNFEQFTKTLKIGKVKPRDLIEEKYSEIKQKKIKSLHPEIYNEKEILQVSEDSLKDIEKVDFSAYSKSKDIEEKTKNIFDVIQNLKNKVKNKKSDIESKAFSNLVRAEDLLRKKLKTVKTGATKFYMKGKLEADNLADFIKNDLSPVVYENLNTAFNEAKKHKGKIFIATATGGGLYALIKFLNDKGEEETKVIPLDVPDIATGKGEGKSKETTSITTETTKQVKPEVKLDYKDLENQLKVIQEKKNKLNELKFEYEKLAELHDKTSKEYTDKLTKILPATMLFMSKSVLNTLADDDLPVKIKEAIDNLPATALDSGIHKLILGYTVAKSNGINTKDLSMFDLMALAENPNMVENIPEQVVKTANVMGAVLGNIYKAGIGNVKFLKDTLEAKKQIIGADITTEFNIYKSILDELRTKLEEQKANQYYEINKEKVQSSSNKVLDLKEELKKYGINI